MAAIRLIAAACAAGAMLAAAAPASAGTNNCQRDAAVAPSSHIVSGELDGLRFNVLLPTGYAATTRRYPVLESAAIVVLPCRGGRLVLRPRAPHAPRRPLPAGHAAAHAWARVRRGAA